MKLSKSSDPLWRHVGFIIAQMDGLQAGFADWAKAKGKKVFLFPYLSNQHMFVLTRHTRFNPRPPFSPSSAFFPQPLSMFDIQFLNAVGDLLDLIPALAPSAGRLLRHKHPGMGHCSALIKVRRQIKFQVVQNSSFLS